MRSTSSVIIQSLVPDFLTKATKEISSSKSLFEGYLRSNEKLNAVKALKDLTGGGLRECKQVCDLYWDGELIPDVKEERKKKLERLAKKPLVEELIIKIKSIDEKKLNLLLMNLTIDDLLSLDEKFENDNNFNI